MAAAGISCRGLFFILSLSCLVYVADSLTKKELENARKRIQKLEGLKKLYPLLEEMKVLLQDYPPLLELPDILIRFVKNSKAYFDKKIESHAAEMVGRRKNWKK